MLNTISYPPSCIYRSNSNFEPLNFFMDSLSKSTRFDMLLGYFSSSAIKVLSLGFSKFLLNGGRARFVINHILSANDKAILLKAEEGRFSDFDLIRDYNQIKQDLDAEGEHFFNCVAWLIANKRIEIISIKPKDGQGIAHFKSGIFSDGDNDIYFTGSCNFTGMGLVDNLESVEIRPSWLNIPQFNLQIDDHKKTFVELFEGKAEYVDYLSRKDIEVAITKDFGNKDLNELLADEQVLLEKRKQKIKSNYELKNTIEALEESVKQYFIVPRFPHDSIPRDYQIEAYKKWVDNNRKGIFAMATGTGKTITAINCILEEYKKDKIYQAVILVPTIALVEQWQKELQEFNFRDIIRVSSKEDWVNKIDKILLSLRWGGKDNFIIIATYATFSSDKFQRYMQKLPENTLFIADEAHNIGSNNVLKVLPKVIFNKRIGLSATPERVYDHEGTALLKSFFGCTEDYTYVFNMSEAIEKEMLCPYKYYPHIVVLEPHEMEEYIEISKKLAKFFDPQTGHYQDSAHILLQKRVRIIQRAVNKLNKLREILKLEFEKRGNLTYSFVFVPEGFSNNLPEEVEENIEEEKFIELYNKEILAIDDSIRVCMLTGKTTDRKQILQAFAEGDIHVITSMKCLDEGVDIPRAELAVFCSSTGNPRQFIQRRGRVLRKHKDKQLAVIHDLIVVPSFDEFSNYNVNYAIERSLMQRELTRVAHFVDLAQNKYEAMEALDSVCNMYQISINILRTKIN